MKFRTLTLSILLITLSVAARAGDVTILSALPDDIYSVSKDAKKEWLVNDRICFRRLDHRGRDINLREILACGQVLDILEEDFLVHVTSRNIKLKAGQKLKAWKPGGKTYERTAQFAKRTLSTSLPDPLEQRVISLGVQFMAPFLHIEQGITDRLMVGFQTSFNSQKAGLGTVRGFAYHLTASYYIDELLQGPFVLFGAGFFFYSGKVNLNDVSKISPSVHLSVGWRFLLADRFSIGLTAGGQYILNHTFSQFLLDWSGFIPVALVQIGYKF